MIPLPVCRWRGESTAGAYICHSAKYINPPNRVGEDDCRQCAYVDHEPVAPPRKLPCVHMAGPTGELAECRACAGRVQLKLFRCHVHGTCLPPPAAEAVPGGRPCLHCPDYLPREPFGADSAEMLRRAEAFLAAVPEYPADKYHGRGVVIAGGGERYFASLYVTVRALRHVGCRLPIQVWYLGRKSEMPADRQSLLAPYQVECIDADVVRRSHPARILNGWELKAFATLLSPFEEVLFLDADCYPCRNPEFLFERDDYRDAGAIFWPDMATIDPRLKWAAFGVADPHRPGSVESGQFVVHKRSSWRPLNLTWFYNDYSDYYYRYCYGDKHTFEVAWARCGSPLVMWQSQACWEAVAYLHPGPDGLPLFIHRCADKFRLDRHDYTTHQNHQEPVFHARLLLERECWTWMAELARLVGRTLALPTFAEEHHDRTSAVPLA